MGTGGCASGLQSPVGNRERTLETLAECAAGSVKRTAKMKIIMIYHRYALVGLSLKGAEKISKKVKEEVVWKIAEATWEVLGGIVPEF